VREPAILPTAQGVGELIADRIGRRMYPRIDL
jgi:hypothetical protein